MWTQLQQEGERRLVWLTAVPGPWLEALDISQPLSHGWYRSPDSLLSPQCLRLTLKAGIRCPVMLGRHMGTARHRGNLESVPSQPFPTLWLMAAPGGFRHSTLTQ